MQWENYRVLQIQHGAHCSIFQAEAGGRGKCQIPRVWNVRFRESRWDPLGYTWWWYSWSKVVDLRNIWEQDLNRYRGMRGRSKKWLMKCVALVLGGSLWHSPWLNTLAKNLLWKERSIQFWDGYALFFLLYVSDNPNYGEMGWGGAKIK